MADLENQVDQAQASKLRLPVVEIKMIITDLSRGSRNKFEFSPQSVVGAGSYGTGLFMLEKNADFEAAAAAVAETAAAAAAVAKTAAAAGAVARTAAVNAATAAAAVPVRAAVPVPVPVPADSDAAAGRGADATPSYDYAGDDAGDDAARGDASVTASVAASVASAASTAATSAATAASAVVRQLPSIDETRNVMTREGRAANPDNEKIMEGVTAQTLGGIWLAKGTQLIVSNYETVKVIEEARLADWKKSDGQYVFQFNVKLHDGSVGETVNALAVSTWNKAGLPTTESCNNKLENIYKLSESLGQQLKQTGFGSRAEAEVGTTKKVAKDESEAVAKEKAKWKREREGQEEEGRRDEEEWKREEEEGKREEEEQGRREREEAAGTGTGAAAAGTEAAAAGTEAGEIEKERAKEREKKRETDVSRLKAL
jgi:hypothetical protein